MNKKYKIIDNFLEEEFFSNIKKIFFPADEEQDKLPWRYKNGIVRDPNLGKTGYEEYDWMYNHCFISSEKNKVSGYKFMIDPIIKKLRAVRIIDACANLLVPTDKHIHHEDHVDRDSPHSVALLYMTTNNGYTCLKETAEVNCVENRMLIFDGSIYHHSVTSTDELRCVININFISSLKVGKTHFYYN
jgi:hypothetical protein